MGNLGVKWKHFKGAFAGMSAYLLSTSCAVLFVALLLNLFLGWTVEQTDKALLGQVFVTLANLPGIVLGGYVAEGISPRKHYANAIGVGLFALVMNIYCWNPGYPYGLNLLPILGALSMARYGGQIAAHGFGLARVQE